MLKDYINRYRERYTPATFILAIANCFYQLALWTPGIWPRWATFLKFTGDIANLNIYPLGRPSIWSRWRKRTGFESTGNLFSAT